MRAKGRRHYLAASCAALLAWKGEEAANAFACTAQNMRPAAFCTEGGSAVAGKRLFRNGFRVRRRQQAESVRMSPDIEQKQLRRDLQELVARHRATNGRALWNLGLTAGLWSTALYLIHATNWYWLSVPFMAMVISRIFMVFHDASHLSFFRRAAHNRWLAE
eukprot:4053334-Amphidinium_carterae.1